MNPMNSLPATEGFQFFDSNTQSLFVTKAKITAATQAITFEIRYLYYSFFLRSDLFLHGRCGVGKKEAECSNCAQA